MNSPISDWLAAQFTGPTVEILGWTLVHFLWQGAAIALVLAAALRGLRRSTPQARYLVACAALAAMAVCPAATFWWKASYAEFSAAVVATEAPHAGGAGVDMHAGGANVGPVRVAAAKPQAVGQPEVAAQPQAAAQ